MEFARMKQSQHATDTQPSCPAPAGVGADSGGHPVIAGETEDAGSSTNARDASNARDFTDDPYDPALIPALRWMSNMLCLWGLCRQRACRRVQACKRDPRECLAHHAPLTPEIAREGVQAMLEGIEADLSYDEVRDDAPEEIRALENWIAQVHEAARKRAMKARRLCAPHAPAGCQQHQADDASDEAVLHVHARHARLMTGEKAGQRVRRHREIHDSNGDQSEAKHDGDELHGTSVLPDGRIQ